MGGDVIGMEYNQVFNGGVSLYHIDSMVIELGYDFKGYCTLSLSNDVGLH